VHARAQFGRSGEDAAVELFERAGFVVERNFRVGRWEIDVVACKPGLVVFCEVKTRTSDRWGLPQEAVGGEKQKRIRQVASGWLSKHHPGPVEVRFDVVSVLVTEGQQELTHIENAF
jgi:putative endonuclease